ncbi:Leucine-, isoleucine-, valine-, threonine-, and alanine-binding protein [Burkholderiales bacterium 8X]|nr:Leucine-, isoleucine-, valine-, threonine-, and alanine-binding protein [Burkholderiales bacterium 8X]
MRLSSQRASARLSSFAAIRRSHPPALAPSCRTRHRSRPPSRLRRFLISFAAIALLGLQACSPVPPVIKIGVAQPLTGPVAALGRDMLQGAQLAVDELNAQGISVDGHRVQLKIVSLDDESSAELGEQVARTLVDEEVVAVLGHLNSGVSIRAAPIYAAAHIPQLAISTQPQYTQLGLDTTLRLVASDTVQARALGAFAATLPARAYALVDDGTSYGKSLADLAQQSLVSKGKLIAMRQSFDTTTTDFSSLVQELKAHPAEVVVNTLSDVQVLALVDQLAAARLTDIQIVGGDTLKTDKVLTRALPLQVFAASPVLEPLEFYRGKAFVAAYTRAFGAPPLYGAHYAYDAIHMVVAAVQRSESVDGQMLTRKLRELDFIAPVNSTMKFGADGEQLYGSVGIYRPRAGRWEPMMNSDRW